MARIIQIMPAEPGWRVRCIKGFGGAEVEVVYQPLIGWALVEQSFLIDAFPTQPRRTLLPKSGTLEKDGAAYGVFREWLNSRCAERPQTDRDPPRKGDR